MEERIVKVIERDVSLVEATEWTKLDRENMKSFEVELAEEFKTGKPKRLSPKNCYRKAFEYVSDKGHLGGIVLVHGLYQPNPSNDSEGGHAWVEINDSIVFDGVLQRFYDKGAYYEYYKAVKQQVYDRSEIYKVGLKHGGTYGPWVCPWEQKYGKSVIH